MFDFECGFEDDLDVIDAGELGIDVVLAAVLAGGPDEGTGFDGVDVAFGGGVIGAAAGFDFHEDGAGVFNCNEVNFEQAAAAAPVTIDDAEALGLEVAMGEVFALAAEGVFRREGGVGLALAQPIEEGPEGPEEGQALFKNFELELHHLAAHDVAEIELPEAAEAGEGVYQEFEAEPPP